MAGWNLVDTRYSLGNAPKHPKVCFIAADDGWSGPGLSILLADDGLDPGNCVLLSCGRFIDTHAHTVRPSYARIADDLCRARLVANKRRDACPGPLIPHE